MANIDLVQLTGQTKKLTAMIVEDEKVSWWNVPKALGHAFKAKERKQKAADFQAQEKKYQNQFIEAGHQFNQILKDLAPIFEVLNQD